MPHLPNDPPQLGIPPFQRCALLGPEFVLVVDGVGDAAGAFDVVEQPDPDVLRKAEAGEVGADCAALVVNGDSLTDHHRRPLGFRPRTIS